MIRATRHPDGSWQQRRPAFDANDYTAPARELSEWHGLGIRYADARARDGGLYGWAERERITRDGREWVTVQEPGHEWAVELELAPDGTIGQVIPVAPERAYALARSADPPSVVQDDP